MELLRLYWQAYMSTKINTSHTIRSWVIQYQVLKALVLREILTRWGRRNIGFLWLFVEQLIVMFCFWIIFYVHSIGNFSFAALGISLTAFVLIGHAPLMLYRGSVTIISNAIKSNTALLHHRNLKALDFYLARFILEAVGNTASIFLLISLGIFFNLIPMPKNLPLLLLAWCMFVWFAFGFGLTIGILVSQYEWVNIAWKILAITLIFISGAYFYVRLIPTYLQKYALMLPWINGAEMIKHGYFGEHIKTYENPYYFALWCLILTFSGLSLSKIYGTHLPSKL